MEIRSKKNAPDARAPPARAPKSEIALLSAEAASSAISNLPNHRSSS